MNGKQNSLGKFVSLFWLWGCEQLWAERRRDDILHQQMIHEHKIFFGDS